MSAQYTEAVHRVACTIPAGAVLTYGDIAELLGSGGPRQVGAAMAHSEGDLPWWRVLRANGTLPGELQERARQQWIEESMPMRRGRVHVAAARWQPEPMAFAVLDELALGLARGTGPQR